MPQYATACELAQTKPSPVDSMREAMFTVSPNRQYLGIACPTTPVYVCKHRYNYTRCSQFCILQARTLLKLHDNYREAQMTNVQNA